MGTRRPGFRSRRAVSEVIATILLLAITVILFSAIFAFVTSFPPPPAQNSNQFQASLTIVPNATATGGMLTAVTIEHLSGPVVASGALIYLKSLQHPTWAQFSLPYSLTAGGLTGPTWSLGQSWVLPDTNFTGGSASYVPDNITVDIVWSNQLLFNVVLHATVSSQGPTFLSVGTTPSAPAVGEGFTISAVIQGVPPSLTASNPPTVSLSGLPPVGTLTGGTMKPSSNRWVWNVSAGSTTGSGTYYAFITATANGKTGTAAVPVSITTYSTLISSAITLGTPGAAAKCTGAKAPVAACQATNDYYYIVSIPTSLVTFGSVLFEVLTSTRTVYSATTEAAFALSLTTTPATVAASWTAAGGAMSMPSSGFTYVSPLVPGSALTTSYEISIDVGTVSPTGTGLSLLVLGINSYSGYTSIALP